MSLGFGDGFAGQRFEAGDPAGWSFRAAVFVAVMPATVVSAASAPAAKAAATAPIAVTPAGIARETRLIRSGCAVVSFGTGRRGAGNLLARKVRGRFGFGAAGCAGVNAVYFGGVFLGQARGFFHVLFGVGK